MKVGTRIKLSKRGLYRPSFVNEDTTPAKTLFNAVHGYESVLEAKAVAGAVSSAKYHDGVAEGIERGFVQGRADGLDTRRRDALLWNSVMFAVGVIVGLLAIPAIEYVATQLPLN